MAGEEDVELRDLVAHTLETRGVLGKIRAQLRASVFLALEEQESQQKPHPLVSSKFQQYLKTGEGQVATALVREFLNFFDLDYTCSVFDPETNAFETYPGRNQLAMDLGLDDSGSGGPLLASVLQRATSSSTTNSHPHQLISNTLTSAEPRQLQHQDTTDSKALPAPAPLPPVQSMTSGSFVSTVPTTSTTTTTSTDDATALFGNPNHKITDLSETDIDGASSLDPSPLDSNKLSHPTKPESRGSLPPISETSVISHNATAIHSNSMQPEVVHMSVTETRVTSTSLKVTMASGTKADVVSGPGLDPGHGAVGELTGAGGGTGDSAACAPSPLDAGNGGNGGKLNGKNTDELDDFFDKKLPSHLDDSDLRELDPGRTDGKSSYQDDFHSDESISEHMDDSKKSNSKYEETEDLTLSQNSLSTDFDYAEPAKT